MAEQRPHITVATVVEREGRFLMVREYADGALVYNQPAGHLEAGESLIAAAERETMEETAWQVSVTALLGIYRYRSPTNGVTYVRHCFIAVPVRHLPEQPLDPAIAEAIWLRPAEIQQHGSELRSPLVLAAVQDYQAGSTYPLSLLTNF